MSEILSDLTITSRAALYGLFGLALLALTMQPKLSRIRILNFPLIYVAFGAGLGLLNLPLINPLTSDLSAKIIEHVSELIVLISLAGAGLAIDTRESWKNWRAAIMLLVIAMPLTLLGTTLMGLWLVGLPLASALLLAAVLAPTDPVLARSVQVSPPGQDEEPMEVALTAEAGLNDGLAFPFVYLALAVAAATGPWTEWAVGWFTWDFLYRVVAGYAAGMLCGAVLSRVLYSRFGDAQAGAWNAMIVVLAATFIAYGFAEAIQGYGFLAVFAAARAGRAYGLEQEGSYERFVHRDADQLESVLLVLLLTWFGMFLVSGVMMALSWSEVALAGILILVLRPAAGLLALAGLKCEDMSRYKVAFFGIRGMGTVFYIAYAQNHGTFDDIDAVWRISAVTILGSIILHGFAANFVFKPDEEEEHPHKARSADGKAEK